EGRRVVGIRRGRLVEPVGIAILDDARHGVGRVLLVGPDHAGGPALDPAGDVLADQRVAVLVADPAPDVADEAAALVERDVVDRTAAIADRAQDEPALDDLGL